MRKNKKISKIATFAIIFIFIILMLISVSIATTVYGGDDGNTIIELYPGLEFRFRFSTVFDKNPNVYCVERGKNFPNKALWYKVSDELVVTDPMLLYILNLAENSDRTMQNNAKKSVKQNLIWWYMDTYNTREAEFIRAHGTNHGTTTPAMTGIAEFENKKQEALNWVSNYNSYSINIDQMEIVGDNVKVTISGKYDEYRVYINDNECYGEKFTASTLYIPLSEFSGNTAKVKLAGVRNSYKASLYVLMRDDSQKLICIFNTGSSTDIFGETPPKEITFNRDVSLQKYITEVNGKSLESIYNNGDTTIVNQSGLNGTNSEAKMLSRWAKKASSNSTIEICASNSGSRNYGAVSSAYYGTNFQKINKPVNIEKGDTVTYNIYVYNNDNERGVPSVQVTDKLLYVNNNLSDGAKISIDDNNIKIKSLTLEIQGKASGSKYVTKAINADAYSIENGEIKIKSFSLGAGETARIIVKIQFNYQYTNKVKNYAVLNVANNNTTKRTRDADYIKMKEYAVSLEKYISQINSTESTTDMSAYSNILSYLRNHSNVTLEQLINKNKDISNEYGKYDLNGDGIVDETDVAIYNSINKNININSIQEYINADINGDGIVNNKDLEAYKILRANLNSDISLNEYDRYMFILKTLSNKGQLTDNVLNYLYIQKLSIKEGKTITELRSEYENYEKSDVNDDGYVNSSDNYQIDGKKLILNEKTYNLNITKAIEKLKETDISDIKEMLDKYDMNNDKKLDNNDIVIIQAYNNKNNKGNSEVGRYYEIFKLDKKGKLEKFEENMIEQFKEENLDSEYNINNDNYVYFDDYILLKEIYEYNQNDDTKRLLDNLYKKLSSTDTTYDLNNDGVSDYKDYEILIEYKTAKEKILELVSDYYSYSTTVNIDVIEEFINNYGILNMSSVSNEDINTIQVYKGWKKYNSKYASKKTFNFDLYDLNGDGKINDKELLDKYANTQVDSTINDILNSQDIDKFIAVFTEAKNNTDLLKDLNIDYTDIDSTKSNLDTLKNIIDTLNGNAEDVLNNVSSSKISNIQYNNIKQQMSVDITTIDANGDGVVNSADISYIDKANNIGDKDVTKITDIEQKLKENDLNEDGIWDNNDIVLSNELKQVENDEDAKNAILNQGKTQTTNEELKDRVGKAEHKYDNNTSTNNYWKYNNIVEVAKGDKVTYTIKVTNNSSVTSVYITEIADYLPDGVKYGNRTYNGGQYNTQTDNKVEFSNLSGTLLKPKESASFTVTVEVTESNLSLETLRNVAEITEMKNKNKVVVTDSTPNDNKDADYMQLKDIIISGTVWNDRAFDKNASDYNGKYDYENNKEIGISDIKVYLYRAVNSSTTLVETTTTNLNGQYSFRLNYIKAPKQSNNKRWEKGYYSYYVVFEYDGIKYTSTTFADVTSTNAYDSNAKEDNGKVKEYRKSFNNRFSTINNSKGINYTTLNEEGYIPQSNHIYNSNMAMQSSTNKISLSKNDALVEQLTHINLGLKGRDTFDLELTSDIYSTKVSVNGVAGEYSYGNNVVTIRKSDIKANTNTIGEDAANVANETRNSSISSVDQNVRMTDIKNNVYGDTKLDIEVTYKLTIKNPSKTDGTATKVADYYDNRYTFVKAYDENGKNLTTTAGNSGTGFKSVVITTNGKMLKQSNDNSSNTMEIYIVYSLNEATKTLESLVNGEATKIPTYNIAEIVEYKTQCASGQTEYSRGLIDIDSAPGSANKEQVRLTTTQGQNTKTTGGNPTTVGYYFGGNDLTKLKYEDDTYATPTLYFVSSNNQRTITGTVFRDNTTTDSTTKIKTGNGKIDKGEVGVYGAQVALLEKVNNKWVARYITTTKADGTYTFKGFLPGTYMIKYYYGNKTEAVLLNQSGNVNKYSYNGEDYQSTNNTGTYGAEKLNTTANYWYLYNEVDGISVATDSVTRRNTVSNNVTGFIDEEMKVLNNMRDGKNVEESKVTYTTAQGQKTITVNNIINKTWMNADTNTMKFNVEKSIVQNSSVRQTSEFAPYEIKNMNFGIAEVPVTTIDLQKNVAEFTITDSTSTNVIASMKYENGKWKLKGDVILATNDIDISIEDDKLQGAKLEVTYKISANMTTEKNFDNKSLTVPTITGIVDYVNNNFSYDENLGDNKKYWELTTYQDIKNIYESQQWKDGTKPQGTADSEGTIYTTVVKAKADNPLLLTTEGKGEATITLEKVLTSTDSTIEDIITSTVDSFEYYNIVEITGLDYNNVTPDNPDPTPNPNGSTTPTDPDNPTDTTNPTNPDDSSDPQRDRIRTPDRYIIVPGVHHDTATSETIVIHPPTGDSSVNIIYYVLAGIGLVILAVGAFGIKKFVLDK